MGKVNPRESLIDYVSPREKFSPPTRNLVDHLVEVFLKNYLTESS